MTFFSLSINISIINQTLPTISPRVNFLRRARKKMIKNPMNSQKIKKVHGHLFIIAIVEYDRWFQLNITIYVWDEKAYIVTR